MEILRRRKWLALPLAGRPRTILAAPALQNQRRRHYRRRHHHPPQLPVCPLLRQKRQQQGQCRRKNTVVGPAKLKCLLCNRKLICANAVTFSVIHTAMPRITNANMITRRRVVLCWGQRLRALIAMRAVVFIA